MTEPLHKRVKILEAWAYRVDGQLEDIHAELGARRGTGMTATVEEGTSISGMAGELFAAIDEKIVKADDRVDRTVNAVIDLNTKVDRNHAQVMGKLDRLETIVAAIAGQMGIPIPEQGAEQG